MGVPKFYRWISERYPCLSEIIREHQIPDFDNLYLDMNGIIHTCSHPNDDDPHFRITEEKIFAGICHYIDFLFKMIKPKKAFFMAVDGVAPRAKMNQQRGRRFRTAKTAIILEEQAKALGESLPPEARFDSNCITPGTGFMSRLHSVLKEFVVYKISSDKLWKRVRVYLSGHETPGEGEHKIMDFIRHEKSQPDYNPNTRHCLYGLDADLIMLGLCSHEPYFSLLREEVKFGKKSQKRIMTPEETTFHLLHISLLRDYLYHEFSPVKNKLSFEFSLENIIDDFVLMSFLVGNDFIPHLPQLHIQHDALPVLFRTYMDVLPCLDGYINEQGTLNLNRFEAFLKKLSEYDFKKFGELNEDFQYLNHKSKTKDGSEVNSCGSKESKNTSDVLSNLGFSSMAISKMAEFDSLSDEDAEDDEKDDSSDDLELEFNMHKTDYYVTKLEFDEVTEEVLKDQAEGYVRAIQWNLHYYYNGVVSWSWYYPHHYSPYISDVKDFKNMEMKFELGNPFLPFQQLLAVLPKLSKDLLPESYQKLMCDEDSPLIDFYPDDFQTDLNGKQQEWEAIVLIPFINEKLLLKFAAVADQKLSDEERKRNSHGPHLLYTYDANSSGSRSSFLPDYYPPLPNTYFKVDAIDPDFFRLPAERIVKGLPKGVVLDKIILGFPTLRILEHTAELRNEKVRVFQMTSMKENMMLRIKDSQKNSFKELAEEIVGKIIHVGWPHLRVAFVVAVSDGEQQILFDKSKSSTSNVVFMQKVMTDDERDIWKKQTESVEEHNYQRWGIFVGYINILLHVKCLSGIRMVWSEEGTLVKENQWEGILSNFALQTTVSNIDSFNPDSSDDASMDNFSTSSVIFVLIPPYYGCMGTILSSELDENSTRFVVDVEMVVEPDLTSIIQNKDNFISEQYMPGYVVAQHLGIESYFVSHLTGTILIQTSPKGSSSPNRVNVGLNLKFNRKNEEVQGFTKKVENTWLYSSKAVKLLNAYLSKFPDFLENLFKFVRNDVIYLEDLYPNNEGHELINDIAKWLKSQDSSSADRLKCGLKRLDSAVVNEIEKAVSLNKDSIYHMKKTYAPQELFNPFLCKGLIQADPTTQFNLFDRVINVNPSSCVPLGLKGTIIGISADEKESDIIYEIVFDKEFFGGLTLSCSPGKGYRLPGHYLINITHGLKAFHKQSPIKNAKANKYFNKTAASDAILKHLQSDNMISAAQFLQKKHAQVPPPNKPFYNVNEMFQTQVQDASPQNKLFSSNLAEASNKQFVTPKAGYVTGNFPGKKTTPSPSQPNYQDFWTNLKKSTPESKAPSEPVYGQKVSVKELFKSVESQNEAKLSPQYNHSYTNSQRQLPVAHTSFVDMLLKLCLKYFSAPPLYSYHNYGNTHLYISSISLPNGAKVSGVPCDKKHEAAASAAEKAVAVLSSMTAMSRNDLHNAIQSNLIQKDQKFFNHPYQSPMFPSDFRGQILVKNAPFPQQPIFPSFDSNFDRPLLRHPAPVQSNRIPDSFVASNQVLRNNIPQSPLSTHVPVHPPVPSDPELFYIPGGGTARIKSQQLTQGEASNLFVPNQVLKQSVKAPFDSSGASNVEWPDLPARKNPQPTAAKETDNAETERTLTISEAMKSKDVLQSVEKNSTSPPSKMTVLTKKPPRRRIAANFQNA